MVKAIINGLNESDVNKLLTFMKSKLSNPNYISSIEIGGNPCKMDWIKTNMNISGEDMVHELFKIYGEYKKGVYTLLIDEILFQTTKKGENWSDIYKTLN